MTKKEKRRAYRQDPKNKKRIARQHAAYQQKNRKKIANRKAEYRRKNKKKLSKRRHAYDKKWRLRSKNKIAKNQSKWRRKNAKKIAKYRQKHKHDISRRAAEYRKKHKHEISKRAAKNREMPGSRHCALLRRHKTQLAPRRGCNGKPMSLEAHCKKLYYADGRDRPCWYCKGENNKKGSGLDRLDNNKTYTVANTVPACRGCNTWRGSTHSVQETRDHFKPMRDAARLKKKENQCQNGNL